MDKRLKHTTMYRMLKIEKEKPPENQRRAAPNPRWDSVELDTESLAQERAYQQQLQMRIGHHDPNKYILPQKENTNMLQQGDGEDDDVSDDESKDRLVYDSLEVAAHSRIKKNPTFLQTEYLDTQRDEREEISQLLSDDGYSDLRYDPNWRTNLIGADCFNDSPQSSFDEYYQIPKEKSSRLGGDRQEVVIKRGYRYICNTSPAVVATPHMTGNECDQPYRLHPQDGQNSFIQSPHRHKHAVQLRSPEVDLSRPTNISTKNDRGGFEGKHQNSCDKAGVDIGRSPELTENSEDINAVYIQEFQSDYHHELRRTQGESIQTQQTSSSTLKSSKVLSNKKQERLNEDIVERNKITLGRHASKYGSYARVHAVKQEMPQNLNTVHETRKEATTAESQEDSSDPEQRWLKKTRQLRVTKISKGKKAQRKETSSPSRQQQPPAPGVEAEWGDCLSSPLASPAAVTQPKPQKMTSSQPLPPTIQFNINLNTVPFLQQNSDDAIMNLASLHESEFQYAMSPLYQQRKPGKSTYMCPEGLHTELHHRHQENRPEQWQSTTALKWPLYCEEEDQKWSPDKPFRQNLSRTPTSTWSQGSGSYTVLPPIGKQVMVKEPELCPPQSVNTTYPIYTHSSGGYLVQMEKQKQLRERVTYKAYSLKDYKQLKPVVTLQGLGPDYTATEKTKLYSNVIREQNKKISRIPFLLAKDPEGNGKKVPRMKALEYAKTISRPPVQSQPKLRQKHQSEGFTEHTPHMEGLDVSQLATLELLRKRHEEEKQAVALFRKVHAV